MHGLAGLPERQEAYAQLEVALSNVRASGQRLVVALIQIDRFYGVNEAKGLEAGNQVLESIGVRLKQGEGTSVVTLISGDTFLMVREIGYSQAECAGAVEEMKYAAQYPVSYEGTELNLTASIGTCLFPQNGRTSERLLGHAETALIKSREQGGNRITFYSEEETEQMNRWLEVGAALRPALYMRQFHLSYQPIFRTESGRLRGFEALIRWNHPELGTIWPGEFIPIAEQNGLIVPIGEWVLREACRMLSGMQEYGLKELVISINVSHVQLIDGAFCSMVAHVLEEAGIEPSSLELEVKEDVILHFTDQTLAVLSKLRALGVRITLDNFGEGYSSLANLKQLPVNSVKISKSFIRQIDVQSVERHIVEAMIGLLHKLEIDVIAGGVEYEEQYKLLKEWNCDFVQGFLLGSPMQPDLLDMSIIRKSPQTA
ncbi:EAL domain-containing protein [Paenibacillus glycanilyticus]|uniref:putative bifunctional diguanylate cyclase/phosphodiesterase n=1 Tax=Paenibacillus glycanilyticus TaxID=126569 RepID=UPI0020402287|nr:GGDEF domain-containing phosphodiesterase [Paenibacillus glycanilyticus]MCM3630374.1 EAL domain-containing protein [Paenibacillus glycanilyticus]